MGLSKIGTSHLSFQNFFAFGILFKKQTMVRIGAVTLSTVMCCPIGLALEPNEILIIANKDIAESEQIAQYYCKKRAIPETNIISLPLGKNLSDIITRDDYNKLLAEPICKELYTHNLIGKIRCLVTTYGVPIKVGERGPLIDLQGQLKQLNQSVQKEEKRIEQLKQNGLANSTEHKQTSHRLAELQLEIDRIKGKDTNASVDSELSMVLFESYELFRFQPNMLKNDMMGLSFSTLMVGRLDGPNLGLIKALVDKAIAAEKTGLKGTAYIDSRGIVKNDLYGHFDQSLRDLAMFTRLQTEIPVKEERTEKLFAPDSCPQTAIYCGWYSLKKYVDAFDFVDGAIGYHISSFEATDLRDPNSTQWCPSMLRDGITATLGAVTEPYLYSFPEPRAFFSELYNGNCLAEAYYRTKPFNSWQLVLIGDPLYRPFKRLSEKN